MFDQSNKNLGVLQARKAAYNAALAKAEQLAKLSNRRISKVKRIESVDGNSYVPFSTNAFAGANIKILVPNRNVVVSEQLTITFDLA